MDKYKRLGEKIKEKREDKNWSIDVLVEELQKENVDLNKSSISRIENGSRQKVDSALLVALSNIFNYNFFRDLGLEVESNARMVGKIEAKSIELPVYGKASAGNGYINFNEVIRTERITKIPGIDLPHGSFIIEVGGDSMFPTLLDGDLAIVKPVQDCCDVDGRICVVTWNDQTFIKRVKYQKQNVVILMSDNPDRVKYEDIIIIGDELEFLKCEGIVVESRRKY